ncbi:unannotated protein [freshwater metagenome]|uniref:Unannotated protein n=1 Tax=freshwater metagenome TaxID=449393 RepID=A0A6J6GEZ2_9ZZZZ
MRHERASRITDEIGQCPAHLGQRKHGRWNPCDVGGLGVGHDGESLERRATLGACPQRCDGKRFVAVGQGPQDADRIGCGEQIAPLGEQDEIGRLGRHRIVGDAERIDQSGVQRVELEEVEHLTDFVEVVVPDVELIRIDRHGRIAAQKHQLAIVAGLLLVLGEVLAQFRCECVEILVDAVDPAIGGDQFRCSLFTDTRNPREIVGRVTSQRCVFDIAGRLHTRAFQDSRFVIKGVIGNTALVVEHADVGIADKLVTVPVAGDDQHVVAARFGFGRKRRDDVIGFETHKVENRHPQRLDDLPHETHLLAEDVRRFIPVRLVRRQGDVAERRFRTIEHNSKVVGLLIAQEIDEHRREAVHGVGDLTRCCGHVGG